MAKPRVSFLHTVCRGTCPRCGLGSVYEGFFALKPACPACDMDLRGHDMGDGPVYVILSLLCLVVPLGALFVEFRYEPPVWVHGIVWPVVVLGLTLGLLRPIKSAYLHQQYCHRSLKEDV